MPNLVQNLSLLCFSFHKIHTTNNIFNRLCFLTARKNPFTHNIIELIGLLTITIQKDFQSIPQTITKYLVISLTF